MYENRSQPEKIRCSSLATSYVWFQSVDGSPENAAAINTNTSDKYRVENESTLIISLTNVTEADGGLYHCVYGQSSNTSSSELCIYVYGMSLNDIVGIHVTISEDLCRHSYLVSAPC